MVKPRPLQKGSHAALIAPSGPVAPGEPEQCSRVLEELGLVPVLYPSVHLRHGYLAGDDSTRAKDLMEAFLDPAIDGIFCIRGGYGASRLLSLLDFDRIRPHPKFFGGFQTAFYLPVCSQPGGQKPGEKTGPHPVRSKHQTGDPDS